MYKKGALTGALLLYGFALLSLLAITAGAERFEPVSETVQVRKALDGDSLLLTDGRQIRLIGVNAPEFDQAKRVDQPLADAARRLVARRTEGRKVRLIFDTERFDRYERTLAYVVLPDGTSLQQLLLTEGLAWVIALPPNLAQLAVHQQAEQSARRLRRGIWSESSYKARPAADLSPADGGFRLVQGRVQQVRQSASAYYLQLAPGMSVKVPRADWYYFPQSASRYIGRAVQVRGWLTERNGRFTLRISHPAMLEITD